MNAGKPCAPLAIDKIEAHYSCKITSIISNDPYEEIKYGSGGEQMAKDVHIGNVAMRCESSSDEDF